MGRYNQMANFPLKKESIKFIERNNEDGCFAQFVFADEDVDCVIIASGIERNGELSKPLPRKIATLLNFPLIFFDDEISRYHFFPAKENETNGDFSYNSEVYQIFDIGYKATAFYMVNNEIKKLCDFRDYDSDFNVKRGFWGNLSKLKETKRTNQQIIKISNVTIGTKERVESDYFWYSITDEPQIKYPISLTSIPPRDTTGVKDLGEITTKHDAIFSNKHTYEFEIYTEKEKDVRIHSHKNKIRLEKVSIDDPAKSLLNNSDEKKKEKKTASSLRNTAKTKTTYPIVCVNPMCMREIKPEERLGRLMPPKDVKKMVDDYNLKRQSYETSVTLSNNVDEVSESETCELENEIHNIIFGDASTDNNDVNMEKVKKFMYYYGTTIMQIFDKQTETIDVDMDVDVKNGFSDLFKTALDRYGNIVLDFHCPFCYKREDYDPDRNPQKLSKNAGKARTIIVTLMGASASGKTIYLTKTMNSYFKEAAVISGLSVRPDKATENYINQVSSDFDKEKMYRATDKSKVEILNFSISHSESNHEVNFVIYDVAGEWFFEEAHREERITIVKNMYKKAEIVLFLFPTEQIDHDAIKKQQFISDSNGVSVKTPSFMRLLERINDEVFSLCEQNHNKKIAFILSKIDKFQQDYQGTDVEREYLNEYAIEIDRLLGNKRSQHSDVEVQNPLDGIETSLELHTEKDKDKKKQIVNTILKNEQEITKEFFEKVLIKESTEIKRIHSFDFERLSFFSYGMPDADINNKSGYRHSIRPFNSIQWLLDKVFELSLASLRGV